MWNRIETGKPNIPPDRRNQMERQRSTVFRSFWISYQVPGCYDAFEIWT